MASHRRRPSVCGQRAVFWCQRRWIAIPGRIPAAESRSMPRGRCGSRKRDAARAPSVPNRISGRPQPTHNRAVSCRSGRAPDAACDCPGSKPRAQTCRSIARPLPPPPRGRWLPTTPRYPIARTTQLHRKRPRSPFGCRRRYRSPRSAPAPNCRRSTAWAGGQPGKDPGSRACGFPRRCRRRDRSIGRRRPVPDAPTHRACQRPALRPTLRGQVRLR